MHEVVSLDGARAVLRTAIHNEFAGQRFYLDASLTCIDPRAKELFAVLAQEEEDHARLLLLEYEALGSQGQWIDLASALSSDFEVDITGMTFPEEPDAQELFSPDRPAGRTIDRRSDDMDALAFGIHLERKAIEIYGQAAVAAQDFDAKQAYEFLLEEETRHLQQLKARWERLAGIPWP